MKVTDVVYDQVYNSSFHEKLDSIKYGTGLGIAEAMTRKNIPRSRLGISLNREAGLKTFVTFTRYSMEVPFVFTWLDV